ncbi:MAG: MlaD family protein [Chromatocurvus sp.]
MGERKHSVLIGSFVVGSLLIVLAGALFVGSTGFGGKRGKVVMVFEGSVKGLTIGAPVALRGVEIGQVTDIQLLLSTDKADIIMQVEAELSESNVRLVGKGMNAAQLFPYLIDNGLRAQLNMQSVLTGLLYIQMDFHPDTTASLPEVTSPHTQIPTIPTELELLRRTLQSIDYAKIAQDIGDIADGLNTVIATEDFRALPGDMHHALQALSQAGSGLTQAMDSLQPQIAAVLSDARSALQQVNQDLPRLTAGADQGLDRLDAALLATEQAMQSLGDQVGNGSPTLYQLDITLKELADASRALQSLARMLEEQPDALLRGRRSTKE